MGSRSICRKSKATKAAAATTPVLRRPAKAQPAAKPQLKSSLRRKSGGRLKEDLAPNNKDENNDTILKMILTKLSEKEVNQLKRQLRSLSKLPEALSSTCAGSDIWLIALKTMCEMFGIPLPKTGLICEIEERKAKWLESLHRILYDSDHAACVFKRIEDLCSEAAYCHTHRKECTLPKRPSRMNSCGFSCNNLSKLFNMDELSKQITSWLESRQGSTGETFDGYIKWLVQNNCTMSQFENVVELLQPKHWNAFAKACNESGFSVAKWVVNSSDYAVTPGND